jgi:hypothetical protein
LIALPKRPPVLFGASPRQAKQYRQSIQVRTY